MKSVAIMPCRNEAWIIGLTARTLLMWVDELIVLDHASTDATPHILRDVCAEHQGRCCWIMESDGQWNEMAHRQRLLETAREHGATHIVMVDADEILTGNLLQINLFGQGAFMDSHCGIPWGRIMQIPWIQLKGDTGHYMSTGMWAEQDVSIAFRDQQVYHWQSSEGEEHFHHRHPKGRQCVPWRPIQIPGQSGYGGLMHLQFLSERRLRAKQCLYNLTERLRWPERQPADYARTVREASAAKTAECPAIWWKPYEHLMQYLDVDAEPWQEAECVRLMMQHGPRKFQGLDLFGVV